MLPLNLNSTTAAVTVASQRVYPVNLVLTQEYGDHHHFEITLDYDVYGDDFMSDPIKHIQLIGRLATIRFFHKEDSSNSYLFKGVVTHVKQTGTEGKKGYLVVSGSSPTIMLEKGKRMDIYSNKTLYNIFKQITERAFSDYMKHVNEPVYQNKIDFLMQYNETDWQFLKRLTYLYRENMFYSGQEILFGSYEEWETVKLTYDKEITNLEFCSAMLANNLEYYQYAPEKDMTVEIKSPKDIENTNNYLDTAEQQNIALTDTTPAKSYFDTPVYDGGSISELLKREKSRTAAQTITIKGKSKTYKTSIGRLINISMPSVLSQTNNIGTYRVIKSIHKIDEKNRYSCEFEAVTSSLSVMPIKEPKMPQADSVVAKVKSNEDPLNQGRIQVDFDFATNNNRAWLRVLTPNAGSSEQVSQNRGMVFIPEKGDQVMIGFEYGDPNRPYVMGSLFHGKNAKGGETDNHKKTIITRQGHTIEFDDAEESLGITIKDKNGNVVHLDTKGKNIEITAPETMTLNAKNMIIEVEENIKTTVGKNIETNVGENATLIVKGDIEQDSRKTTVISSRDNIKISSDRDIDLYGRNQFIGYSDGNTELGGKNQIHLYGGNSLITAKNKIEQKAPNINEIPQIGEFLYDKEPQIVSITWMNEDMTEEISDFSKDDILSLLVYTRNYEKGESISITVKKEDDTNINENEKELVFTGIVDKDGYARLKGEIDTKYISNKA